MNNIILVSDDGVIAEDLKSKLMLLRKLDNVFLSDFLSAEKNIAQNNPQLVIIYAKDGDKQAISTTLETKDIPVIFITDKINDEYILNLYDAGIYDYISTEQSQAELLIKIMRGLKYSIEKKKYYERSNILTQIGILNGEFYSKKYTPAIFKSIINKNKKSNRNTVMMALATDIETKNRCNIELLASLVKQNLRDSDIIGFSTDKLYILLPETNIQGGLDVYNKIKKSIAQTTGISASIIEITKKTDYDYIEQKLEEALNSALEIKNSIVIAENSGMNNVFDQGSQKHKNFKLFRKVFSKKIENIISPLFYQKQKIAEQRLYNVEIEQYCNENKSVFSLKKGEKYSIIEISYPGAVKVNIDLFNDEIDVPERISYDLAHLNETVISDLIDKCILDFQRKDKE